MILFGTSGEWLPTAFPRAEAWQLLGGDLLEAASYPEDVLKAALTLIQAHVDKDVAEVEDSHYPDNTPYLLMVWVQPLSAVTADEEESEYEDDDAED